MYNLLTIYKGIIQKCYGLKKTIDIKEQYVNYLCNKSN